MSYNSIFSQSTLVSNPTNEADVLPRFVAEIQLRNISGLSNAVCAVIFRWNSADESYRSETDYQSAQASLLNILRDFKQEKDLFFAPKHHSVGLILVRESSPALHVSIRNLLHQIAKGKIQSHRGQPRMIRQVLGLQMGWATGNKSTQGVNILRQAEQRTYAANSLL